MSRKVSCYTEFVDINKHTNKGVTLTEVLIILAIVGLFLITAFLVFYKQIFKAQDSKRKSDLHELTNILEDFYNDNGCYPQPTEICYDSSSEGRDNNLLCHICGDEANPIPNFRLPCNPDHPKKKYLYEVENSSCPQWYRIYTELSEHEDSGSCAYGSCGVESDTGVDIGYDYGVSSPNVNLRHHTYLNGYDPDTNACNRCDTVENCENLLERGEYTDIYPNNYECCLEHTTAISCNLYGCNSVSHECEWCGSYRNCTEISGYSKIYGSAGACYDDANDCPSP